MSRRFKELGLWDGRCCIVGGASSGSMDLAQWLLLAHVVEEESAEPAEGTPKGKTAVKEEGKPAKPSTKPTPQGKPANPTPPVSAPPCGTRPHSISRGGNSAGHF